MTLEQIDKMIAPQFPMDAFKVPEDLKFTPDDWVAVVDRAIQLVGEDHVALGSDFDGGPTPPRGMRDVRDLPMITAAMVRRGYSEERIEISGGNVLRLFRRVTRNERVLIHCGGGCCRRLAHEYVSSWQLRHEVGHQPAAGWRSSPTRRHLPMRSQN